MMHTIDCQIDAPVKTPSCFKTDKANASRMGHEGWTVFHLHKLGFFLFLLLLTSSLVACGGSNASPADASATSLNMSPANQTTKLSPVVQLSKEKLLEVMRARAAIGTLPPLLANPPDISMSTAGAPSRIPGSVLVPWNSGKYAYTGNVQLSGTDYPDNLFGFFRTVSYSSTFRQSNHVVIEFVTDAPVFEVFTKGNWLYGQMRFIIDGKIANEVPVHPPNDGDLHLTKVDFGSRMMRHIKILGVNPYFGGVRIGPTDTLDLPPTNPNSFRAMFVGDSITEGPAGQDSPTSFAPIAADLLGWEDVWLSGVGTTGYLAKTEAKVNFRQRFFTDIKPYEPNVLVIAGGLNDSFSYSAAQINNEANLFFDLIQRELPNTIVFVLGPWNPRNAVPAELNTAIKTAAANRQNFYWIPNFEEGWINGTGKEGSPTRDGNSDIVISSDGAHPTPYGIRYLAEKVASAIKAAIQN